MSLDQQLTTNINTFKDNTHQMNTYNEVANLNYYVLSVNKQEEARLDRTNDTLKSAILKARQDYMINERRVELARFKSKVLYFSIIVLCITFLLIGLQMMQKLPSAIAGIIISVVLVLYFIIVFLWILNNSERRNVNWNQYYWPEMKTTK